MNSQKVSSDKPAGNPWIDQFQRTATELKNHNDITDFQRATLDALRHIQQDIVSSKNETMESQQQLTVQILQRVDHLEGASALQALTTRNESNKTLIKHLQKELKAVNERQEEQNEVMGEMRETIGLLRNKKSHAHEIQRMKGFKAMKRKRQRFVGRKEPDVKIGKPNDEF